MANLLQIKRNTTSSSIPSGLLSGELAYVQQTNKLYIGTELANPLWSNTHLQIQSTDSDNGTTINFTKGAAGNSVLNNAFGGSPYGGITHDTSQAKFGTSSMYFNNGFISTRYFPTSYAGNSNDNNSHAKTTLDFWVKMDIANCPAGTHNFICSSTTSATNNNSFSITWMKNADGTGTFYFYVGYDGSQTRPADELADGEWHHVAFSSVPGVVDSYFPTYGGSYWIDGKYKDWAHRLAFKDSMWIFGNQGGSAGPDGTSLHTGHLYRSPSQGVRGWFEDIRFVTDFPYNWRDGAAVDGTGNHLNSGDQAFAVPTEPVPAGATVASASEIKPEFLTYASSSTPDKISLDVGSNKYSFDAPVLNNGNAVYSFPVALPGSTQSLKSDTSGQLAYHVDSSSYPSTLESVGDVENDPQSNEILVYNNGDWVGTDPATLKNELNIEASDSQTYTNLTLTGNLEVKGDSLQLNTSQLQIKDKSLGVGISGSMETVSATISAGGVVDLVGSSLSAGDSIFVGDGNDNIPTSYYSVSSGVPASNIIMHMTGTNQSMTNPAGGVTNWAFDHGTTPTVVDVTDAGTITRALDIQNSGAGADDQGSNFTRLGTGDWTVECWIKTGNSGLQRIITGAQSDSNQWMISINNGNLEWVVHADNNNATYGITSSGSWADGNWHHVAVVRSSGSEKLYVDGVFVSDSGPWSGSHGDYDEYYYFFAGSGVSYSYELQGLLAEVRISNIAVYTSAFDTESWVVNKDVYPGSGVTFSVSGYSGGAITTPFDLTVVPPSTDNQVDGAGLVFPGDTEKSLKWNDTNDNFEIIGGDLKVSGNEVSLGGNTIINNSTNQLNTELNASQISGQVDGGEYT